MSVLTQVLRETGRGLPPQRVAAVLGVDEGLVQAALDHAERIGLVLRAGGAETSGRSAAPCGTGCRTATVNPLACAGCPFAR